MTPFQPGSPVYIQDLARTLYIPVFEAALYNFHLPLSLGFHDRSVDQPSKHSYLYMGFGGVFQE